MSTLKPCTCKWILTIPELNIITCLAVLFSFSANAQLPGQLPVNLKTFKARAESNNKVKVFWTTSYEKDNGYFDIERSEDAVHFTKVGRVPGVNQSGILTDYIFYDNNALKGISFYRLKQVDVDTKFSYSPIERVNNTNADISFDAYPNPSTGGMFKINLLRNVSGIIDVQVFDLQGRLQFKQQISNSNTVVVKHQLAAGWYTVKVYGQDFKAAQQLLVQ